jgi:hypothetical protein
MSKRPLTLKDIASATERRTHCRLADAENKAAILLASKIACGQIEVLLRFATAAKSLKDARRFSKMIHDISEISNFLARKESGL